MVGCMVELAARRFPLRALHRARGVSMLRRCVLALALAAITAFAIPHAAFAQQAPWRITSREGVVRVRTDASAHDASVNEIIPVGAAITTGANSSAGLSNGLQRVTMAANSRMTISANEASGVTRIIQSLGSLLFQVDHREAPHFFVDTPRLAAIVKGTTFSVAVYPRWDIVAVSNGLVEVRSRRGNSSVEVATGHAARVDASSPDRVALTSDTTLASAGGATQAGPLELRGASGSATDGLTARADAPVAMQSLQNLPGPRLQGRGNDFLVKALFAYLGISFLVGFGAFLGFKKFDQMSRRRNERESGR